MNVLSFPVVSGNIVVIPPPMRRYCGFLRKPSEISPVMTRNPRFFTEKQKQLRLSEAVFLVFCIVSYHPE